MGSMVARNNFLSKGMPKIAFDFFAVFAKAEYALKRSGFLRKSRDVAEPDWDKFATDLGKQFFEEVRSSNKAEIIIKAPPKKQTVVSGRLDWKDTGQIENVEQLFGAIRRIRNNLFHGGKYPCGPIEEVSRNSQLLSEAIDVIKLAIDRNDVVKNYFEDH